MTETEIPPPTKYAPYNPRMLASSIDVGLALLIVVPVVEWLSSLLYAPVNSDAIAGILGGGIDTDNPGPIIKALWKYTLEQHLLQRMVFDNMMQFIGLGLCILPFWFRYSTTPGKMLFRLQIRDAKTLEPMTREQAMTRYLGYVVSAVPLTLGFIWPLFNRKKQGFHDLIAGTVVIVKPKKAKVPK